MPAHRLPRKRCLPHWTAQQRLDHYTKIDPLSGCHLWQGARVTDGYGRITIHGRSYYAHRLAWTIKHGPIPKGMDVCHRCDERRCMNPDHLFVDTHAANMADMKAKWEYRRRLGVRQFRSHGGLPPDVSEADIAPIRILCNGIEIIGDVVVRRLAAAPQSTLSTELAGDDRPRARRAGRSSRTRACRRGSRAASS
jgi:hypothetical protein